MSAHNGTDPLARLFGSPARLKLLRLFLFNEEETLTVKDAEFRARVSKDSARREIAHLIAIGLLKKRSGKGGARYGANLRFMHYEPLKSFLRSSTQMNDGKIVAVLKKAGSLRLVTLSGLFTGALEPKIDVLIVGDRLDERVLTKAMQVLEADLGRELRYASFTTKDFRYRLGVYDRLVRDVFDYPHRVILEKTA